METKMYNPKLRALLSIRNLDHAFNRNFDQMKEVEENLHGIYKNAISVIEENCTHSNQIKWEKSQENTQKCIASIHEILKLLQKKIEGFEKTDSTLLWKQFEEAKGKLIKSFKASEKIGFEILPEKEHIHWEKDVCNFEKTILELIISHAETCKKELLLIEKYKPKDLDNITKLVASQIPDDFTFEEADKFEAEYLKAFNEMKIEFRRKKNHWEKFLDLLAGGTSQTSSESEMVQKWVEGEKEDSL